MKLYLADPYRRAFDADVLASVDGWLMLASTAFYPGGGGQPADRGTLVIEGETVAVEAVREDERGDVWHRVGRDVAPATPVRGQIDWPWRLGLMRAHALMHVVNTVVRDRFGGIITGVQLGPDRSRIDFKLEGFGREEIPRLDHLVNEVLERDLPITDSTISESEFDARPELVRTLDVKPPVIAGRVRVVEIAGFDVQACGGTHVHRLSEVGRARVVKFDNKGKNNKRFYWELVDPRPADPGA